MGEALEIAKVLVAPTTKLIEMVGQAIGTVYEPRQKRKLADATAYEISVIGEAMRNAADVPIVYDKNGVAINSEDFNRLMQRTGTRLALQEATKQLNIENIIDNAYGILEKEEKCSDDPVEQGWINRFFDSVADISDEDLQNLWGKVLAGEIKQPNSYSLRILDTLKNISKHEAELFQKIAPFILERNSIFFLPSSNELLEKYNIAYRDIMILDECGLINSGGFVSLNLSVSNTNHEFMYNKTKLVMVYGTKSDENVISIGEFKLTRAGKELFALLDSIPNDEYVVDFAEEVEKENHGSVKISIYQINSIEEAQINYQLTALHTFPINSEEK